MKLTETYANNCSVDIKHKPFLMEKYFPLPDSVDKYITLQNSSGMPAKNYSFWAEVVDILLPILEKENIKIITLGDKDSPPINRTINLCGKTSIHQSVYLINRALLHMGNDSILGHVSCANNIPTVLLYGSTTVENHSPYHHNPKTSIFLESHRNGNKASFAREEMPKTIDLIDPETVAESVCKLLGLSFDYPYKTVTIGNSYANKIIESDCTNVINLQQLSIPNIIVRCDYNFNLAVLMEQMRLGKVCVVTNKPIPINILAESKSNIIEVLVEITKDHNPLFIKELLSNGIPYRLYTRLSAEDLNKIKLDYIDYGIIVPKNNSKPEKLKDIDISNLYYKGSKITLGKGKIYSSKWAYINNFPQESFNIQAQRVTEDNINLLWEEDDCCLFLSKKSN